MSRDLHHHDINPPLLNSSTPWATTKSDLEALYDCPYTGAVTTRTSLLEGFADDPAKHQHTFFNADMTHTDRMTNPTNKAYSSLNSYGYSPVRFQQYLDWIIEIIFEGDPPKKGVQKKPFIISVTGTAKDVATCYSKIRDLALKHPDMLTLAMEINLSCPNIPAKPPPAYSKHALKEYLDAIAAVLRAETKDTTANIPWGVKTPPFTYQGQFDVFVGALLESAGGVKRGSFSEASSSSSAAAATAAAGEGGSSSSSASTSKRLTPDFITSTNTLGSSLALTPDGTKPAISSPSGQGIGGLAGAALHPIALGNVATLKRMLSKHPELKHIKIIGVGGVGDAAAYKRMKAAGADFVGVGTAFGKEGLEVFRKVRLGRERRRDSLDQVKWAAGGL